MQPHDDPRRTHTSLGSNFVAHACPVRSGHRVRLRRTQARLPADMRASVLRFLEAMNRPLEAAVLGAPPLRELYFRVLTGAQGSSMREALAMKRQYGKIGR